jgi:hypothetical protein
MVDVPSLRPLVSSAEEKNDHLADPCEVNTVTRAPINPQLHYPFAHRLDVAQVADRDSREPRFDARTRLPIVQSLQPIGEGARPAEVW